MDGETLALSDDLYELAYGLWWPKYDRICRPSIAADLPDLVAFAGMCPQNRVVVQAGGNVGVWPKNYAKFFGQVYTYEPDKWNWECLRRNVTEPNVFTFNAALGAAPGRVSIQAVIDNCGANFGVPGDEVEVVTIDALELQTCDLIQLDIEGFELEALKGAERTLLRCSPLVILEQKGHTERYGTTDSQVNAWLKQRDYQIITRRHRDTVFKRVGGHDRPTRVEWK